MSIEGESSHFIFFIFLRMPAGLYVYGLDIYSYDIFTSRGKASDFLQNNFYNQKYIIYSEYDILWIFLECQFVVSVISQLAAEPGRIFSCRCHFQNVVNNTNTIAQQQVSAQIESRDETCRKYRAQFFGRTVCVGMRKRSLSSG